MSVASRALRRWLLSGGTFRIECALDESWFCFWRRSLSSEGFRPGSFEPKGRLWMGSRRGEEMAV